jgi:predicted GIY-YIG superfamily endonuclease
MSWFVYILLCSNGSYYVGHTTDVERRLTLHTVGLGAKYTAVHTPEQVLYQERFQAEVDAVRRERQIKKWSHAKKQALIAGNLSRLHELAKSRD